MAPVLRFPMASRWPVRPRTAWDRRTQVDGGAESSALCAGLPTPHLDDRRSPAILGRPAVQRSGGVGRPAPSAARQRQEDRGLTPSGSTAARGLRRGNSARSQFGETMIVFRDWTRVVAACVTAGLPIGHNKYETTTSHDGISGEGRVWVSSIQRSAASGSVRRGQRETRLARGRFETLLFDSKHRRLGRVRREPSRASQAL